MIAWNHRAEDLWGLRADEVRGKNFLNLDIGLPIEQLRRPIRACLNGDAECSEATVEATNRRGKPSVPRDVHAADGDRSEQRRHPDGDETAA